MTTSALERPLGSRDPEADPVRRLYPEIQAGGFTRCDHRVIFFARVNALLRNDMTVLDFGAGRGIWAEIESGFRLHLTTLRGKCKRVIGADLDRTVLDNPLVDEAIVLPDDGSIPIPDQSVDMIVSWAVFEHLEDPAHTAAELDRILRPGGWIAAIEAGLKECIVRLHPETQWLFEELQSPPLALILEQYWTQLHHKPMYHGKEIVIPPSVIGEVKKGVTIRNKIVHGWDRSIDLVWLEEFVNTIGDLVWIFDYVGGVEWAIEYVRKEQLSNYLG